MSLLLAFSLVFPAVWGWLVWWAWARLWPKVVKAGAPLVERRRTPPSDFQI